MAVEAIIFDMDGVLVDTEPYWLASRTTFAARLGKSWTMDDQHHAMGRGTVEWAHVMRERLMIDMPIDEIIEQVRGGVLERIAARMPALPGALEAVHTAASACPVALASGSPTQVIHMVMGLTGLDRVFEVIVYGDEIPRGKPEPDIYFEAARRLGIAPERCLGIEDSANGLRALRAAGMKVMAVPSPGFTPAPEVLALADIVMPSLEGFSLDLIAGF